MRRTILIFSLLLAALHSVAIENDDPTAFAFGILKSSVDGSYTLQSATTTIPRRLKSTGFRFGIAFQNPGRRNVEWHEVIHFPSEPSQATGTMHKASPKVLKTEAKISDEAVIVDDFWFDEGDPLGRHRMDLYIDRHKVYSVEFEVVE